MPNIKPTVSDPENINAIFRRYEDRIRSILRDESEFGKFEQLIANYTLANPELLSCTTGSYVGAIISCATAGLVPNDVSGECYILPYKNVATFQISYKGLLQLAYRNKDITDIQAVCVWQDDEFEVLRGTENKIIHKPSFDRIPTRAEEKDKLKAVYAVATVNGNMRFEVMSKSEIDKIQSEVKTDKFWGKWYGEMAKKTVVKRLLKTLPREGTLNQIRELDSISEGGRGVTLDESTGELVTIKEDVTVQDLKLQAVTEILEAINTVSLEDREARGQIAKKFSKLLENGNLTGEQKTQIQTAYNNKFTL
jgi:recombination protein RecT